MQSRPGAPAVCRLDTLAHARPQSQAPHRKLRHPESTIRSEVGHDRPREIGIAAVCLAGALENLRSTVARVSTASGRTGLERGCRGTPRGFRHRSQCISPGQAPHSMAGSAGRCESVGSRFGGLFDAPSDTPPWRDAAQTQRPLHPCPARHSVVEHLPGEAVESHGPRACCGQFWGVMQTAHAWPPIPERPPTTRPALLSGASRPGRRCGWSVQCSSTAVLQQGIAADGAPSVFFPPAAI